MPIMILRLFFIIQFFLLSCGYNTAHPADLYKVTLPDGSVIEAELAKDKAKGLQNREYLCPNCGMIFVFDKDGIYSFWMKDTLISLSLIWIDNEGNVVHIVRNAKPCKYEKDPYKECERYFPKDRSKYVLEILPKIDKSIEVGSRLKIEQIR